MTYIMTTQALLQNVPTGLMFTEQISKENAKKTIAKAVSDLNAIPIDSDHNVKLVTEKAKELSSSIKALDDLRKAMNAPDQARINERMEAFRYITGEAEAAIQAAKKASSAYLAEITRQREEEERAAREAAEREKARISALQQKLLNYSTYSLRAIDEVHTLKALADVFKRYDPANKENAAFDPMEYAPQWKEACRNFIKAHELKYKALKTKDADAVERLSEKIASKTETLTSDILHETQADIANAEKATAVEAVVKTGLQTRKLLRVEVINEGDLDREFMSFDEKKTLEAGKKFIDVNTLPKEGMIVSGVRFYTEDSYSLR